MQKFQLYLLKFFFFLFFFFKFSVIQISSQKEIFI